MNIIERMRQILTDFPRISEVCNEIHIDFTDPAPTGYGLSSVDDKLLWEDILGNQQRQHTFLLYSTFSGINDYERLQNSTVLLELGYYLHNQPEQEIDEGTLTKISAGNGMIYDVPQENTADGVQYQMQIIAEYTRYAE